MARAFTPKPLPASKGKPAGFMVIKSSNGKAWTVMGNHAAVNVSIDIPRDLALGAALANPDMWVHKGNKAEWPRLLRTVITA